MTVDELFEAEAVLFGQGLVWKEHVARVALHAIAVQAMPPAPVFDLCTPAELTRLDIVELLQKVRPVQFDAVLARELFYAGCRDRLDDALRGTDPTFTLGDWAQRIAEATASWASASGDAHAWAALDRRVFRKAHRHVREAAFDVDAFLAGELSRWTASGIAPLIETCKALLAPAWAARGALYRQVHGASVG